VPLSFICMKKNDYNTHLILTFTSENDLIPLDGMCGLLQKSPKPVLLNGSSTPEAYRCGGGMIWDICGGLLLLPQ